MEIFSRIRTGVKPDINALSVILILVSGLVALWLNISATRILPSKKGLIFSPIQSRQILSLLVPLYLHQFQVRILCD